MSEGLYWWQHRGLWVRTARKAVLGQGDMMSLIFFFKFKKGSVCLEQFRQRTELILNQLIELFFVTTATLPGKSTKIQVRLIMLIRVRFRFLWWSL